MNHQFHIVIPVRLASQRLPGKPLLEIAGKPMIEWVWRQAQASAAASVVIATDAPEIADTASGFGATTVLTSSTHTSGSDRIAECADRRGWGEETLIVNLQGDEPLMPPACLDQVAALLAADQAADVASLHWPIEDAAEVADPNVVKVVVGTDGSALYFSRAPIPHARDFGDAAAALRAGVCWHRHVGLYAYRAGALRAFAATAATPLERAEKLEQLRFLESGRRIAMARALLPIPAGVDTPEDLRRVRRVLGRAD